MKQMHENSFPIIPKNVCNEISELPRVLRDVKFLSLQIEWILLSVK